MTPAMAISFSGAWPRRPFEGAGFISSAAATSTTPGRLRSFSAYLSSGWPETKKPSTSFSAARRWLSSRSGTLGRSSCLRAVGRNVEDAKESGLPGRYIALGLLRALHGLVDGGQQLCAAAEGVERASLDQRFNNALVQQAQDRPSRRIPERMRSSCPSWSALRAPSGSSRWRCGRRS